MYAPDRSAPVRLACARYVDVRNDSVSTAPLSLALVRYALLKSASAATAPRGSRR